MSIPPQAASAGGAVAGERALRAGLVAGASFALLGWRALLVPSLILLVAPAFGQADAGLGAYYLATALAYGVGALFAGRVIRRFGARRIIPGAAGLMAAGLVVQGVTGAWLVFATAGLLASVGASSADVGIQALVLDLFPRSRGRSLNLLHVAFGTGALLAPILLAALVGAGVGWQWLIAGSGVATAIAALAMLLTIPRDPAGAGGRAPASDWVATEARGARRIPLFLVVMAVSIVCYVAAESGVSDWLVRYLEALPIAQASLALTLYWAGVSGSRLLYARFGTGLDAQRSAAVLAAVGGGLLLVALLAPVGALSPLLFGAVGLAFGPVFPLVVASAGARMPREAATVTGVLVFAAVIGAVVYPPAIGFLSGVIGLQAGMLGTALLGIGCGASMLVARRMRA